jgi:hypothetical protein
LCKKAEYSLEFLIKCPLKSLKLTPREVTVVADPLVEPEDAAQEKLKELKVKPPLNQERRERDQCLFLFLPRLLVVVPMVWSRLLCEGVD